MSRDVLLQLALLLWFVVLAMIEVGMAKKSRPTANLDADARLLTNFGFTALYLLVGALLPLATAVAAVSGEGLGVGLANYVPMPWLVVLVLTLLGLTFANYWTHRWVHQNSLLWRIHRVHHADTAVDVSTSLRNHPLELLVTVPTSMLVILTLGAPIYVVAVVQTINLAGTIWEHADIELPPNVDRALATIFITPGLHRLHHNPERPIHDSNFGTVFSFWDRLFGTFRANEERGPVGLNGQVRRPDHFVDQIWSPLVSA